MSDSTRKSASTVKPRVLCANCPLKDIDMFEPMSDRDAEFMQGFKKGELQVQPGSTFLVEGSNSPHLYTVLDGWGFRYKTMEDGRRQILNFVFPGDLVGIQGSLMREMEHSVEAMSDMLLCVFERDTLFTMFEKKPEKAYDVTWLAAREEQILDENLLSVGRRTAVERAAYLVAFLHQRAVCTGMMEQDAPLNPFTQTHVADTLGLSLVHTNKTLKKLRDRGLIEWSGKSCFVKDAERLAEIAGWDGLPDGKRPYI